MKITGSRGRPAGHRAKRPGAATTWVLAVKGAERGDGGMSWKGWVGWGCTGYWKSMGFSCFLYPISVFSELFSVPSKSSFHTVLQNQASGPAMVQLQVKDPRTSRLVMESHAEEGSVPQSEIYIYIYGLNFMDFIWFRNVQMFFFVNVFIGKTMMIISCGEVAYFQTNPHVATLQLYRHASPHVAIEVFQVWTSIQMGLSKIIGVPKIRWFRASSSLFIATNWNKLVGIYIYIYIYASG